MKSSLSWPLVCLSLLAACGKAPPNPTFEEAELIYPTDGSNIMGKYKAEFITLNTDLNGFLTTNAYILRKDDRLQVSVKLTGGAPNVWHKQDLYLGQRCPEPKDDLNQDGLIDIVEGNKVWGNIILPLDGDISSQSEGKNSYPKADYDGDYTYKRTASFSELFEDLKNGDAEGNVVKLPENQGLGIQGNVIIILGTDSGAGLPDTVATIDGLPAHKTFPVACGLIRKLSDDAGEMDGDAEGDVASGSENDAPSSEPLPTPSEPEVRPPPPLPREEPEDDWTRRIRRWWSRRWSEGPIAP